MRLSTTLVLLSIGATSSAGSIHQISKQHEFSYLARATVKILERCYGNQTNTVGLSGNSDGILIKALQFSTSFSVTLLDSTRRAVSHDPVQPTVQYQLQIFAITASSATEVEENLRAIKNSIWWNHMASAFILVRLPVSENGCSKASEMLLVAWKMNLINTKLTCLVRTKDVLVYTFNPFKSTAPSRWKLEETYAGLNGHPWTLFMQRYQGGLEVCEDLDFDKTRDLGGYKIRGSIKNHPGHKFIDFKKRGVDIFVGPSALLPVYIYSALNATPDLLVYNLTNAPGYNDENGRDLRMDVEDGISDILLNQRYTITRQTSKTVYPYAYSGIAIITQYKGHMSQLDKIRSVVDGSSRIGICIVILVTVLFFVIFLQQNPVLGILNVVRLICNGSLLTTPTNLPPRLYLSSLFIFIVTMQAIYQGKLATLLTKPVLLPNVNTLQDLVDGNYTLYTSKITEHFFQPPDYMGRLVTYDDFSCVKYVLQDPSNACALDYYWSLSEAATLRLHKSRGFVVVLSITLLIRRNWPLEDSVNKYMSTAVETDFLRHAYERPFEKAISIQKFYEKQDEEEQFSSITLDELSFVFAILGIGLGCATICFITEKGIELVRPKISTNRRYLRNQRRDINTKKSLVRVIKHFDKQRQLIKPMRRRAVGREVFQISNW